MTVDYLLKKLGLSLEGRSDLGDEHEEIYTIRFSLSEGLAVDVKMPIMVLIIFAQFSPDEQSEIVRELVALFGTECIGMKRLPFEDDDTALDVMLESTSTGFQITLDWAFQSE